MFDTGVAITMFPVSLLNPAVGDQVYEGAPVAVSTAESPAQIKLEEEEAITDKVFETFTVMVAFPLQPLWVSVTE